MMIDEIKEACNQLMKVTESKRRLEDNSFVSLYGLPEHVQTELKAEIVKFLEGKEETFKGCIKTLANYKQED